MNRYTRLLERLWIAALLMASLLFVACSDGDDDDDDDQDDQMEDDTADDASADDSAGDDTQVSDDTGDDDSALPNALDCFESGRIRDDAQICQYFGADMVGKAVDDPGDELTSDIFPSGFEYENRDRWDEVIYGTDLGQNLSVNGKTWYFFGDTHPVDANAEETGPIVGLAWGYDDNADYQVDGIVGNASGNPHYDSITEHLAFDDEGNPTGLLNDIERNAFYPGGDQGPAEAPFFVPCGQVLVDDTIYLWYGKYINNTDCDQSHLVAYNVSTDKWRYVAPFATGKFIQVNAVLVEKDEMPDMTQCPLPWADGETRGLIVYGSGRPVVNTVSFENADPTAGSFCSGGSTPGYRVSDVYLGFINLSDIEDPQVPDKMYYFTGASSCWEQGGMVGAAPLMGANEYGEFSVKRVPGTDYLVMTHSFQDADAQAWEAQHPEYGHHYVSELSISAAALSAPWQWGTAKHTDAYGYGNYLIEDSLRVGDAIQTDGDVVAQNVLFFVRVISTWKGPDADPTFKEYGTSLIWGLTEFDELVTGLPGAVR